MSLTLDHLSKDFDDRRVLNDVTLKVAPGEIFGIIGMSGAGKTTLVRCLAGLDTPSEGTVTLNHTRLGMIFQHFNLFSSRTALENVLFPMEIAENVDKKKAQELLMLVGLAGKENVYPPKLSGGQKQRVAIARALANDPSILICDEATSALDPHTTRSILSLLAQLNTRLGLTIVLITHDMEVIKQICTRVAVLEHGQIIEEGAVEDLFAAPKHPTTCQLMQNLTHMLPEGRKLYRLSFKGESAEKPIISQMLKKHDVEVNILLGGIDALQTMTVGTLVVELLGSPEEVSKAGLFLQSQGVRCDALV